MGGGGQQYGGLLQQLSGNMPTATAQPWQNQQFGSLLQMLNGQQSQQQMPQWIGPGAGLNPGISAWNAGPGAATAGLPPAIAQMLGNMGNVGNGAQGGGGISTAAAGQMAANSMGNATSADGGGGRAW